MARGTPPKPDELEVSLFGRGVGECVVVHAGENEWLVVDSCTNPDTARPVALEYLEELGVDVASAVIGVVVSHWHNDHICGVAEVLEQAESATLHRSAALNTNEFWRHVAAFGRERVSAQGDVEHEFTRIAEILRARAPKRQRRLSVGPELVQAGKVLFERSAPRLPAAVTALSPSSATMNLSFHEVAASLPRKGEPKRRAVAQRANSLSVALWVAVGGNNALLGGDLETGANPATGWNAVVGSHDDARGRAATFKVPHHGSATAHHAGIWERMLVPESVAALAPYLATGAPQPAPGDVARLKSLAPEVYSTTRTSGGRPPPRNAAVDKTAKEIASRRRLATAGLGQVRIRRRPRETSHTELFGAAIRL